MSGESPVASSSNAEMYQSITETCIALNAMVAQLKQSTDLKYSNGISLLGLKNDVLLSYIHHLVFLFIFKLKSHNATPPPSSIITELVKLRVVLEKIRPLEGKLRYQVEKLLRKAQDDDAGQQSIEEIANDPLAFRPNPSAFNHGGGYISQSDSDQEESLAPHNVGGGGRGIYKPPRVAPTPYLEPSSSRHSDSKKQRPTPTSNAFLTELATSLNSSAPYTETTSGLSVQPQSSSTATSRKLNEMQSYEEDNLTRVSMSKKQAKKRKQDEATVATGSTAVDTRHARRGKNALGVEFDDLLGRIERGGKQRNSSTGKIGGKEYEMLRGMRREHRGAEAEGTHSIKRKEKKRKGGFEQALERANKRSKR